MCRPGPPTESSSTWTPRTRPDAPSSSRAHPSTPDASDRSDGGDGPEEAIEVSGADADEALAESRGGELAVPDLPAEGVYADSVEGCGLLQ